VCGHLPVRPPNNRAPSPTNPSCASGHEVAPPLRFSRCSPVLSANRVEGTLAPAQRSLCSRAGPWDLELEIDDCPWWYQAPRIGPHQSLVQLDQQNLLPAE